MLRRMAMLATLTGAILLPGTAFAQQYPPASGALTVDRTAVAPGGAVHVSGSGCTSNATTTLAFDGTTQSSTAANSGGAFAGTVTVPSTTSTGSHTVSATCPKPSGGTQVLAATITVTGALPRTGSASTIPLLVVASGLVILGAVLVVTLRTRSIEI